MSPNYLTAQEGFFVWGIENGMLPGDVDVLPAVPTLSLGGYSSVPSMEKSEGTQPINAVGMRAPADFLDGEAEARTRFGVNLGTGTGPRDLVMANFTDAPIATFPTIMRHQCLPVLVIGGGAMSACNSARSYTWLSRHQLMNTMTINAAYKQPVSVQFATEGISIVRGAGILNATQVNPTAIRASGGKSLAWQHMKVYVGSFDLTRRLSNVSIQHSNNITRDPAMRGELGDDNPLSRTSCGVSVGNSTANVNFSLAARLPDELVDAGPTSRFWENIGPLFVEFLRFGVGYRFKMPSNILSSYNQSEVQPQGRFGYSASLMGADLTAEYVA